MQAPLKLAESMLMLAVYQRMMGEWRINPYLAIEIYSPYKREVTQAVVDQLNQLGYEAVMEGPLRKIVVNPII